MLKTHYYLFYFIILLALKSCSDNKYTLYAKINSENNDFNSADIFCHGLNLGKADNSGAVTKLEFFNNAKLSKVDTIFLKQNPLGTKYFDIIKSNKPSMDNEFYKTFDTINILIKSKTLFLDSIRIKRIEKQFINTLDSLNAILK